MANEDRVRAGSLNLCRAYLGLAKREASSEPFRYYCAGVAKGMLETLRTVGSISDAEYFSHMADVDEIAWSDVYE